ncbi:DUF5716 family protein [Lachnospiraceae bacterium 62-35]
MDGLVLGLDLCDTYTKICCFGEERVWTVPTVVCKKKGGDEWFVGEEAYAHTLTGTGTLVDKLLSQVMKDGTATIEGIKFEARELFSHFLGEVLSLPAREYGTNQVTSLVAAVRDFNVKLMEVILACGEELGIPRKDIHVISHTESFVYYVLSQKRDVWSNQVGMFDLSEESLRYYEMKIQRGLRRNSVVAEYEKMEEGFNLDILENESGARLADKILTSFGERMLGRKLYSGIFLCGQGFEKREWAVGFMQLVCSKRRVFLEADMFARGAACRAADYQNGKAAFPYVCLWEGRLKSTVSLNVQQKDREGQLIMAAAGESWYEANHTVELLTDGQDYVEFQIAPMDQKKKKIVKIQLEGFPVRPDRTTRIQVSVGFLDEHTMSIGIEDKGFGDLFPTSHAMVRQEVMI